MFSLPRNRCFALLILASICITAACTAAPPAIRSVTQLDDNFTDNQNGWNIGSYENSEAKIENGALLMTAKRIDWGAWFSPGVLFPEDIDVQVSINVANITVAPDWTYSINLRASGRTGDFTFYTCYVKTTGRWGISAHINKSYKNLKSGSFTTVVDPQRPNRLRCVIKDDQISMYMNDQLAGSVRDNTLPKNGNPKYIQLAVYNGKNGSNFVQVAYRNLSVRPAQ